MNPSDRIGLEMLPLILPDFRIVNNATSQFEIHFYNLFEAFICKYAVTIYLGLHLKFMIHKSFLLIISIIYFLFIVHLNLLSVHM